MNALALHTDDAPLIGQNMQTTKLMEFSTVQKHSTVINDSFGQAIAAETGVNVEKNILPNIGHSLKAPDSPDSPDGENPWVLTNQDFLSALFDCYEIGLGGSKPNVIGKKDIDKGGWSGSRWSKDSAIDDVDLNWYLTLAAYTPETTTKRKQDCTAICGLMLDDLGSKALPLDRLSALPPTFVIETSLGNYQAGFMFDVPQTDLKLCEAINKALIDAQLCDSGATGPTSRWGRLPNGSNTKRDPVFQCRLHAFNPELRYTPDQIIEGLELDNSVVKPKEKPAKVTKTQLIDSRAEDVFVPRTAENEVITALKLKGLYKKPLGGGKHEITCPWLSEHTDQIDHGTVYFEPNDLHPAGGFHCQHSHGQQRKLGALLEFLQLTFKAAKHKPTIRVCPGEAHRIADATEKELADSGRYYQSGGLITSIVTDPASEATVIKPLKLNALLRAMGRVAVWERFDKRADGYAVTDPVEVR